MELVLRKRRLDPSQTPWVMGILNVTPDSFSDGGVDADPRAAAARAERMIEEGADVIDVGPESTRPGAVEVPAKEQTARAIPVIREIRRVNDSVPISIDTRLSSVAQAAIEAGADMVNDVSALRDDPRMSEVVAQARVPVVLMHRRGTPADMQTGGGPHYDDPIGEIEAFLRERRDFATTRGVESSRIVLDPGIGFGKRIEHNLLILRCLDRFVRIGQPLLVGASRKSFLGVVIGAGTPAARKDPSRREAGSLACAVTAAMAGAAVVRVHDVRSTVEAMRVCRAMRCTNGGGRLHG